ncbi:hypothetical protein PO909_006605 [Leuciscus waleckii]
MSTDTPVVCDYSDSDDDFVPPSPLPTRRSSRIQGRGSPWASWPSEDIIIAVEAAGIPISRGLSREDLLNLAFNTLGNPPQPAPHSPATAPAPGQTKQAGKKRTAKSSSPHPAKRSMLHSQASTSLDPSEPAAVNYQILQAVQSLSQTVKTLESKMSKFEHSLNNSNSSVPAINVSAISQLPPSAIGLSDTSNAPSTSALPTFQTSSFNLSSAVPAQSFGRRFVSPAAAKVSPLIRANIVQDTVSMQASLPSEKLVRIRSFLESFSSLQTVSKRDMLSLLGHLNFAMSIIPQGRAFISRLLTLTHSVEKLSDQIHLDDGCLSDIQFWKRLLSEWNGISFFYHDIFESSIELQLFTDATPSIGFGGFFQGEYLFSETSIRLLLKGLAKSSSKQIDKRLPITLPLLHKFISSVRNGLFSFYINILLEAVFLAAFYGFMRPGEFSSDTNKFDPTRGISFSDICFSSNSFTLVLKHSKNDAQASGVTLSFPKINNNFCPFTSMVKFLKIRPKTSNYAPLFILPNGAPLSKGWFRTQLNSVVKSCSLSPSLYTGHSFRIGAATTAADRGISTSAIKVLGRWSSSAFESYIRPDSKTILQAQQALQ